MSEPVRRYSVACPDCMAEQFILTDLPRGDVVRRMVRRKYFCKKCYTGFRVGKEWVVLEIRGEPVPDDIRQALGPRWKGQIVTQVQFEKPIQWRKGEGPGDPVEILADGEAE